MQVSARIGPVGSRLDDDRLDQLQVTHARQREALQTAIGSNEATARLCGIPVVRTKVLVYTVAGLLTGWAGVLVFAQTTSGDPAAQVGLELKVIAAVVIGGASLSGGQGNVVGTLLGVLILSVLDNAVRFCGVPVEVQYILIGAIVVVNTAISQWQRRRSE